VKVSQKIVSSVLRACYQKESPKCFETHPSQPRSFENFGGTFVGCLKITEDGALDASLMPNARVASQPKCEPRVLCQTRRSRSRLRHRPHIKYEGRISTQTRISCPLSDTEVAFQPQTHVSYQTRVSRLNPNANLASFARRGGHILNSDAGLMPNVRIASQPKRGPQLRRGSQLRRRSQPVQRPTTSANLNQSRIPTSNADFINNMMQGSRSMLNTMIVLFFETQASRSHFTMIVLFFETQASRSHFNIKTRACVASRSNTAASL